MAKVDPLIINRIIRSKMSQGHSLTLTVTSGSMWPIIKVGDQIVVNPSENDTYKVGDIVVFFSKTDFIVHRVKSINLKEGVIVTKGDSSISEDPKILISSVLGKVENVPGIVPAVLNCLSPVCGCLNMIFRRGCQKIADLMISSGRNSFTQICGIFAYKFSISALILIFRLYKISGFITRSCAIADIVAGRTDIDMLVVVDNVSQIPTTVKKIKFISKLVPILSMPAILDKKDFNFWMNYGGALRLEYNSWIKIGKVDLPEVKKDNVNFNLSLLNLAYEIYLKLWREVIKLSRPDSIYHAKNISNFQKYLIDAVRCAHILDGKSSLDAFKLKRHDYLDSVKGIVNYENNSNFSFVDFAVSSSRMDSKNRSQVAISYFLEACKMLEESVVKFANKNNLVLKEFLVSNPLPWQKLFGEFLFIYNDLTQQELYQQILGSNCSKCPMTSNLLIHIAAAIPLVNQNTRSDFTAPLHKSIYYRDISELIISLGYASCFFNLESLRNIAAEVVFASEFQHNKIVTRDLKELSVDFVRHNEIVIDFIKCSNKHQYNHKKFQVMNFEVLKILKNINLELPA